MTFKFYTLLSLLFIMFLGNMVYFFITNESVALNVFDIQFSAYPIAIWVTVPFIFFYLINVLLMSVGNVRAYFRLRNYEVDYAKFQDQIFNAYLNKDKSVEYKTARYKKLGAMLENSTITPKIGATVSDTKINEIYEMFTALNSGEVQNLKSFSLDADNPLMIQNMRNKLAVDENQAEKILNSASIYDADLLSKAFSLYCGYATPTQIERYKSNMDFTSLEIIINRMSAEENQLAFTLDEMIDFISNAKLSEADYIAVAKLLKTVLVPDERIHLFTTLANIDEKSTAGNLYTYLDLEMLDLANELLENYDDVDFPLFRAYLVLKKNSYGCNIDILLGQ